MCQANNFTQDVIVCDGRQFIGGDCENPLFYSRYAELVMLNEASFYKIAVERVVGARIGMRNLEISSVAGTVDVVHCAKCDAIMGYAKDGFYLLYAVNEVWDADEHALFELDPEVEAIRHSSVAAADVVDR